MSEVINRGSCPRLPANLTRATKPALIDEVQRAAAELAEARELLLAIAEMAESDYPRPREERIEWTARLLGRIQSAASDAALHHRYNDCARALRALLADDRARAEIEAAS